MWLATDPAGAAGANLWWLLGTVITVLGGCFTVVYTTRNSRTPKRGEITAAVDEAIEEYRTTFTEPLREENKQLRDDIREYRRRLRECEDAGTSSDEDTDD